MTDHHQPGQLFQTAPLLLFTFYFHPSAAKSPEQMINFELKLLFQASNQRGDQTFLAFVINM